MMDAAEYGVEAFACDLLIDHPEREQQTHAIMRAFRAGMMTVQEAWDALHGAGKESAA